MAGSSQPRPTEMSTDAAQTDADAAEMTEATDRPASEQGSAPEPTDRWTRLRHAAGRVPIELVILMVLAAITRFAFLYDPRVTTFDEHHFRGYALHYLYGTYYFDLHPPLGKQLLGAWAALAGVDAVPAGKDPAVAIRILPAFAGTLLIGVVYALIRQLSGSRRIATLGAGLLLLDNAVLVESRFIFMDSLLLLFGMGAVSVALLARQRTGRSYWWLLAASAFLAGCAIATKLTGLSALGLVGVLWIADLLRRRRGWRTILAQAALLAVIPVAIHGASYAAHVAMLTKSGPGDAYMSPDYQATLKGNQYYRPDARMSMFAKIREINATVSKSQKALEGVKHPHASPWTTWPINKRSIFVFYEQVGDGKQRFIYTLGNPVVWWGVLLGIAVVAAGLLARPKRFKPHRWPLAFLALGWAVNYLPFALIDRPMFLYHYLFALIFSLMFVVIGLGALTGWNTEGPRPFSFATRRSRVAFWGILGVALASFLYLSPLIYGIPLTPDGLADRMWLSTWR